MDIFHITINLCPIHDTSIVKCNNKFEEDGIQWQCENMGCPSCDKFIPLDVDDFPKYWHWKCFNCQLKINEYESESDIPIGSP